jgi:hypothetical protein
MKLLEFKLPASTMGSPAGYAYSTITAKIKKINKQCNINIVEHLREGHRYVVECSDSSYIVLCMMWQNDHSWEQWRVITANDLKDPLPHRTVKPRTSRR